MTEAQIRDRLDWLDTCLSNAHNEINAIANREAQSAIIRSPNPYSNSELTAKKTELIEKSDRIIDKMQALIEELNALNAVEE